MTQVTRDASVCKRQQQQSPKVAAAAAPNAASSRMMLLPHHPLSTVRPLLCLDLDETLVHASIEQISCDVAFDVDMGTQIIPVYVKIRPFAKEFLRRIAGLFEIAVFTASLAPYADLVVNHLDPSRTIVHHRLFRQHCTNVDGAYIKDMTLLGRNMERVAIVDNSPVAYSFQPENGIPIVSWFDDRSDSDLLRLLPMLEHFAASGNIFQTKAKFRNSY